MMGYTASKTHEWFGLSYASWLVLPRLALQEMPPDWQERFYALIDEAQERYGMETPETIVNRRDARGRFIKNDPWSDYRHGTVAAALEQP